MQDEMCDAGDGMTFEPLFAARKWKISTSGREQVFGRSGPKKERSDGWSGECGRSYDDMVGLIRSTDTPTRCSVCRCRSRWLVACRYSGIEIILPIAFIAGKPLT